MLPALRLRAFSLNKPIHGEHCAMVFFRLLHLLIIYERSS